MSKIEITDDMVERYWSKARQPMPDGTSPREHAIGLLEAALNPPVEPEVVVTEEMRSAAVNIYLDDFQPHVDYFTRIYRAMHAVRPKAEPDSQRTNHFREGDRFVRAHRRAGDPK